jgi:hypothetical protein
VRANEYVILDDDLPITNWSSGTRVKMGDNRRSKTDDTVVSDAYIGGMYLIDVHQLADPDVSTNRNAAQALQPRAHTESAGGHKSYLAGKPTEQGWQSQWLYLSLSYPNTWNSTRCHYSPE